MVCCLTKCTANTFRALSTQVLLSGTEPTHHRIKRRVAGMLRCSHTRCSYETDRNGLGTDEIIAQHITDDGAIFSYCY